ncbi:coiled-coil domain-containing protein 130 homolog [Paramacrobiotus metropolitanus]|uniref:coiled-coil domain-containing protein 130 homolog n=1 Tax=Paramacrobiotus metropolitanus TaxID=2943436 RepID=UPI002445EA1D|nr:coiled-coil domain-containing protein 130 homolog [Paramacrobiotus metropolitanus]
MGERKGQNKYYPPDWRPELGGLNKFHGTHALAERASKIHLGILTIRFEMPFNIWCDGCGNHIGMGVRYNAEKRKVGMYYTTPLWEFRMKCHLCDNYFEFRTDPKNFDYEVVSGARRQERRWDPESTEAVVATDKATSQKLLTDAMFKLEHGKDDQIKAATTKPVIDQLTDYQSRMKDDYEQNSLLRSAFRSEKKKIKLAEDIDRNLIKKSSLSISLVPETEEDRRTASLMKYMQSESMEERQKRKREEIDERPVLPSSVASPLPTTVMKNLSFHLMEPEKLPSPSALGIVLKGQKVQTEQRDRVSGEGSASTHCQMQPGKSSLSLVMDGYGSSDSD